MKTEIYFCNYVVEYFHFKKEDRIPKELRVLFLLAVTVKRLQISSHKTVGTPRFKVRSTII